jgi:mono/diheme cytochrome c family protein
MAASRRQLKRLLVFAALCAPAWAHDIITTPITWDREISRIVFSHCASCHRDGGLAFSLMTYKEARPWAEAIKEEVLARTMPPWGAVKGFADYRNDQALTPEQLELITSWADGGVPEGQDKDLLPPPAVANAVAAKPPKNGLALSGDLTLKKRLMLDGLWPQTVPPKASFQITATLPDGSLEPLLWLEDYKPQYGHPFLLRTPIELLPGTVIRGVPPGASVLLIPVTSTH